LMVLSKACRFNGNMHLGNSRGHSSKALPV
jgi:hypothetical protein